MSGNDFPKLDIKTVELIDAVEALIEQARKEVQYHMHWGVNWGDIGVVDVEYRKSMLDKNSQPYCIVCVEEAASGGEFAAWLNKNLNTEKFSRTYIICEW